MNQHSLQKAVDEAKRFLRIAEQLKSELGNTEHFMGDFPKQSGAVRRASMDLTRTLAEMRKPG